jgi:transcriptional regulator with XRE-family HTH domain
VKWTRQGKLLREARIAKNHTQLQAATAMRLNARDRGASQMVSNIERNKQAIPLKSVKLAAVYCGVSEWRLAEIMAADYFDRVMSKMEEK